MASDMARQVGARIAQARKEKKWTQRQVADAMDVKPSIDKSRISEWERGVHIPNERYMNLIAKALEHEVAWFYAEDDETPDLVATLNGDVDQLDRIEAKLDALKEWVSELLAHAEGIEPPDDVDLPQPTDAPTDAQTKPGDSTRAAGRPSAAG